MWGSVEGHSLSVGGNRVQSVINLIECALKTLKA